MNEDSILKIPMDEYETSETSMTVCEDISTINLQ